jgi:hypothetical protein
MKIPLYKINFSVPDAWGLEGDFVIVSVSMSLYIGWFNFWFNVTAGDTSYNTRTPFAALLMAVESGVRGETKYERLKDKLRRNGMWQQL